MGLVSAACSDEGATPVFWLVCLTIGAVVGVGAYLIIRMLA